MHRIFLSSENVHCNTESSYEMKTFTAANLVLTKKSVSKKNINCISYRLPKNSYMSVY